MRDTICFVLLITTFVKYSFLQEGTPPHIPADGSSQTQSATNGPIHLRRDTLDHIYDYGCFWCSRATTDKSDNTCRCKSQYGTLASQSGDNWNCLTNVELDCDYSLVEDDIEAVFLKGNNSRNELYIFPPLYIDYVPGIKNIFLWNFGLNGTSPRGNWELISDIARPLMWSECYWGKTRCHLEVSGIDLAVWGGHVIKVHFGEFKKCLHFKIQGEIRYPFNITEFKQNVIWHQTTTTTTTKDLPTTTFPTTTTTSLTTNKKGTTILRTTTKTTTTTTTTHLPTTMNSSTTAQPKIVGGLVIGGIIVIGVIVVCGIVVACRLFRQRQKGPTLLRDVAVFKSERSG